ncbi:tetratricopeptide repeat protein [Saccharopolyspora phatthalungensis]|uniref:Tetratricopeptide (TPR) repeat protein n=1 Tax=Saccharopolyspora phatthalungensis TaxID=664693 RepID=A0A840Q9L0_9PSEU|nr:tetratricopeptide repeat protein [Saccharopolyspora phatthalungensis]MBB5156627.1 tetratricopeptide (TPR) repeat protein [Saccharopolyspora phatthalungensis]
MSLWEQRVARARQLWTNGDHAAAEHELRAVWADGDFDAAAHAAWLLGALLDEHDDAGGARAIYQRAIDSGHPIYAQLAAIALGRLLFNADDLTAAQAVLRIAADGTAPDAAGHANALLAQVLHTLGDTTGAREAHGRALTCNDPGVIELAREVNLPGLGERSAEADLQVAHEHALRLLDQGRDHEAEPILRRLLDSGHPNYGSLGAAKLYTLHVEDSETARRMAERIIAYRHPEHLGWGYLLLGGVLADLDEAVAAADAFQRAAEDPHPDVRLHALIRLGMQLCDLGRSDEARETYQQVINTRHPRYSVEALGVLGELQRDEGDIAGAVGTFGRVADSGHPEKAPLAAYNMGVLLYEHGDRDAAAEAFRRATEAEDPHLAHQAALALSTMDQFDGRDDPVGDDAEQLVRRAREAAAAGDFATAQADYQQVIDLGLGFWSVLAANSLGLVEAAAGDMDRARRALRWAAMSDDGSLAQDGAFRHALLGEQPAHRLLPALLQLENNDETLLDQLVAGAAPEVRDLASVVKAERLMTIDASSAVEMLSGLVESPNLLARTKAAHLLADWLVRDQRHDEAQALLNRVVGEGHPALRPWAATFLGDVLLDRGDFDGTIAAFETALGTGHPTVLGEVFGKLALMYRTWDRHDDLLDLYRRTAAGSHPEFAPQAAFLLGEEFVQADDLESALDLFAQAADSSSTAAPAAAFGMHAIRQEFESARASFRALTDDDKPHQVATQLCLNLADRYQSRGAVEFTEWALRLVVEAGHAAGVQQGWLLLGALRNELGDADGAAAAWEQAARGGNADEAAVAKCSLANLLSGRGEPDRADALLAEVAGGEAGNAAEAALKLGVFREERGDLDGAIEAFRRAESVGSRGEAAHATANIAILLARQGKAEPARQAFERVISSGVPGVAAYAALELGNMLRDAGDEAGAKAAYERALEFDEPDVTPYVYRQMGAETAEQRGFRLIREGDVEGARAAIREHYGSARVADFWCAACTDPAAAAPILGGASGEDLQVCSELGLEFGRALASSDPNARAFFRMVADHGHPSLAPKAQIALGELAEQRGERAMALVWYRCASAAEVPEAVARAGVLLGQLLVRLNDREGAKSACRHVIAAGSGAATVDAGLLLGHIYYGAGDVAEAKEIWDRSEESAESPAQFGAALHHRIALLGEMTDEALELLRRATTSPDPITAVLGMALLGERAGDQTGAFHWFGTAAELGVPGHSYTARGDTVRGRLGELLLAHGDRDAARIQFERVSRCDAPEIAALGEFGLGLIRYEENDFAGAVAAFVKTTSYVSDGELAESALNNVRVVLDGQRAGGDHLGAAETLRRLVEVVPEHHVAEWAYEVGAELVEAGDCDAALIYLRCAVQIGAPEPAPAAVLALGEVLHRRGDLVGARQAYEQVLAAGDERHAEVAQYRLVELPNDDGPGEAQEFLPSPENVQAPESVQDPENVQAPESVQDPESVQGPEMTATLRLKLHDVGDRAGVIEAFREAADSADDRFPPMATYALAQSLRQEGKFDQARQTYLRLIESEPDDRYAGEALLELASMAFHAEDDTQAREWSLRAWESADPELSAKAAMNLGVIAKRRRDFDTATPWFLALIDLGHSTAALAAAHLAEMHYWREEHAEAIRHYEYTLANTEDRELVAEAAYRVGEIHYRRGEVQQARELLGRAARTEDPAYAHQATRLLARLGS